MNSYRKKYQTNTGKAYEDIMGQLTEPGFLGPITRAVSNEKNDTLMIGYSIEGRNLNVIGNTLSGTGEVAGWENVDNTKGIMTLVYIASRWDEYYNKAMSEYQGMVILLHKHAQAGSDDAIVTNKQQAKQFFDQWSNWYKNL